MCLQANPFPAQLVSISFHHHKNPSLHHKIKKEVKQSSFWSKICAESVLFKFNSTREWVCLLTSLSTFMCDLSACSCFAGEIFHMHISLVKFLFMFWFVEMKKKTCELNNMFRVWLVPGELDERIQKAEDQMNDKKDNKKEKKNSCRRKETDSGQFVPTKRTWDTNLVSASFSFSGLSSQWVGSLQHFYARAQLTPCGSHITSVFSKRSSLFTGSRNRTLQEWRILRRKRGREREEKDNIWSSNAFARFKAKVHDRTVWLLKVLTSKLFLFHFSPSSSFFHFPLKSLFSFVILSSSSSSSFCFLNHQIPLEI